MVPAASTRPVTRAALAASTADRRGIAARVVRIMPVLYSPLMASTARMATTAWPNSITGEAELGRVDRADGTGRASEGAVAAAPTPTVAATIAASSQAGPATVRSLVHSACSASRPGWTRPGGPRTVPGEVRPRSGSAPLMRPSGAAGHGHAQRDRGIAAQHREAGPRRQRVVSGPRRVGGGDLRVLGHALLDGEGGGRGDPQQPVRGTEGQHGCDREDVRQHDRHDDRGDRDRAAPHHGADGQGEDGGDGQQRRGADYHPHLGQPRHREHVQPFSLDSRADRDAR